ncbi:MAG: peptidoglycan recognition family protein [Planctomycetota bacterium]
MGINRRQALLASIAALTLGGCRGRGPRGNTPVAGDPSRIGPDWGGPAGRPSGHPRTGTPVAPPPSQTVNRATHESPATLPPRVTLSCISRSQWTRTGPIASRVNPMNGINKLTIHHEGWRTVYFSDRQSTAARIEQIRNAHVNGNRWGDIGYHYIVDRAGRVWEGRAITSQGAHVRQNNEHNLGVLVLGNFDKQSPSDAQYRSVITTVSRLRQIHNINRRNIRSHQEIVATQCPGRVMQQRMDTLRRSV